MIDKRRRKVIYKDWSEKTVMEACDGTVPAIELRESTASGAHCLLGLTEASELFRAVVLTSALSPGTRKRYLPL
jgi:hypothetical protein